jgi:hypothetical protein
MACFMLLMTVYSSNTKFMSCATNSPVGAVVVQGISC